MSGNMHYERGLLAALAVGTAMLGYVILKRYRRAHQKRPGNAVAVGTVKELTIYPVKSVGPIAVKEAYCGKQGMVTYDNDDIRDRAWMVVDEKGLYVTLRQEPRMALVAPSVPYGGDMLRLDAPDMLPLQVSKYLSPRTSPVRDVRLCGQDTQAVDCGDEAADWFNKFLNRAGLRLVYTTPAMGRTVHQGPMPKHKLFPQDTKVSFPDIAPIHLVSEASITDLNSKMPNSSCTALNFRPNVVITDCDPFEEDAWKEMYIGQVQLINIRKCDRCLLTTVDPDTGIKDSAGDPLATLKTYRLVGPNPEKPCLGIHMIVGREGLLKVGDTVYAVHD